MRKDLVEADAYRRSRLVDALVRGAGPWPGDDVRRGSVAVGGIALALLLVAGTAVRALLWPGATPWDGAPGLVIVAETGERFLVAERDGPLQPVANLTSAQLVLGAGLTPTILPEEALAGRQRGPEVGIVGAPQRLPTRSGLIESGWSACTADGAGIAYALAHDPAVVAATGRGALVRVDGGPIWVVAMDAEERASRYRVPRGQPGEALLARVGLPPVTEAVRVPAGWLDLFPPAGTLQQETWVRARWSAPTLAPVAAPLCAQLVARSGGPSAVRLATLPPEATWTAPPAGIVSPAVDPGGGALVSSGGRRWIVDERALADPIETASLAALGFDADEPPVVPPAWLALLGAGVPLSRELALQPVEQTG